MMEWRELDGDGEAWEVRWPEQQPMASVMVVSSSDDELLEPLLAGGALRLDLVANDASHRKVVAAVDKMLHDGSMAQHPTWCNVSCWRLMRHTSTRASGDGVMTLDDLSLATMPSKRLICSSCTSRTYCCTRVRAFLRIVGMDTKVARAASL